MQYLNKKVEHFGRLPHFRSKIKLKQIFNKGLQIDAMKILFKDI